jgi:hypothetical protein
MSKKYIIPRLMFQPSSKPSEKHLFGAPLGPTRSIDDCERISFEPTRIQPRLILRPPSRPIYTDRFLSVLRLVSNMPGGSSMPR